MEQTYMDDKLKEALEFSNFRLTLNNQKQNLKQRMNTMLTIGYNGSMFTSRLELINFVKQLLDLGVKQYVFLDDNENPVMVTDLLDFHSRLLSLYTEALNEYYVEHEKLKKMRDTKKLVGLNV
jgi:hypothetical protein